MGKNNVGMLTSFHPCFLLLAGWKWIPELMRPGSQIKIPWVSPEGAGGNVYFISSCSCPRQGNLRANFRLLAASPGCCLLCLCILAGPWCGVHSPAPSCLQALDQIMSAPSSVACLSWVTPLRVLSPGTSLLRQCPFKADLAGKTTSALRSNIGMMSKGQNYPVKCSSPQLSAFLTSMETKYQPTEKGEKCRCSLTTKVMSPKCSCKYIVRK